MKVIIDCDPGIDDSYALSIASFNEDVEILAITVAHGNVSVDHAAINAKLVLDKVYPNNKPQPPIYIGAVKPIIKKENAFYFHHKDGLAGTHETLFKTEVNNIKETFLKERKSAPHAASKIVELVNNHPNEVTIIALAPLTNLALALKLSHDPVQFTKNIKKLVIMGGNEPKEFSNEPNHDTSTNYPEFNFRTDPTAAKIVLDEYLCPIKIITYDCCLRAFNVETNLLIAEFKKHIQKSKRCYFLERIGILHRLSCAKPLIFYSCDLVAVIGTLHSDECQTVYKKCNNLTIQSNNSQLDGLIIEQNESHETKSVELCITMNSTATYEIFKSYLEKFVLTDEKN